MATTKGAKGRRGPQGKSGARGTAGVRGPAGVRGSTGVRGPAGVRGSAGVTPDVKEVAACLDRIQELADELAKCHPDLLDQMHVATRLRHEIEAARRAVKLQQ